MKLYLLVIFLSTFNFFFCQRKSVDSAQSKIILGLNYGLNNTFGDLAKRYGAINHLGGIIGYKTNKNFFWGIDGNFSFGNQLRTTDLLVNLRDEQGVIVDINGEPAGVVLSYRGFNANAFFGILIPFSKRKQNSGLLIHAGLGYTQHRIRIDTQNEVVPQIEKNYRKGYDRYATGLNFHQFIGYAYFSNRNLVNFFAGFYFQEGLTKDRREIYFDQPQIPVSKKQRLDGLYGIKAGWIFPIGKRKTKDFYLD